MPDAPVPDILDDAACQRALAILVDVGTSIAKELKAPSNDMSPTARARAFAAVSMAVRRTITLIRHITEAPPPKPVCAEAKRVDQRKQIIRDVEQAIANKADPAEAPALRVELLERIDSLEFAADLANRTPASLIVELCRDLGVVATTYGLPNYLRRTPEDIALLCAQAAAPAGSGLPQWSAAADIHAKKNDQSRKAHPRDERRQL